MQDKYLLICRTSGVHRLPIYCQLTRKGPYCKLCNSTETDKRINCPTYFECEKASIRLVKEASWVYSVKDEFSYLREGYKLIFIHPNKVAWIEEIGLAYDWIQADTTNDEECYISVLKWLKEKNQNRQNLYGIFTFDDFSLTTVSYIGRRLYLPHMPLYITEQLRDKFKLRQLLINANLPCINSFHMNLLYFLKGYYDKYFIITKDDATISKDILFNQCILYKYIVSITEEIFSDTINKVNTINTTAVPLSHKPLKDAPQQFPLIIKPISGSGSNFVQKVQSLQELKNVCCLFVQQYYIEQNKRCKYCTLTKNICCTFSKQNTIYKILSSFVQVDLLSLSERFGNKDIWDKIVTIIEEPICEYPNILEYNKENQLDTNLLHTASLPLKMRQEHWRQDKQCNIFILEEMMEGKEVHIDLLFKNGKTIFLNVTDKFTPVYNDYTTTNNTNDRLSFIEIGGTLPSLLSFNDHISQRICVQKILNILMNNWNTISPIERMDCEEMTGVWHMEVILCTNLQKQENENLDWYEWLGTKVYPIPVEINQRLGGSEVSGQIASIYGIDIGSLYVSLQLYTTTNNIYPNTIPKYFSFHPMQERMNRIGWNYLDGIKFGWIMLDNKIIDKYHKLRKDKIHTILSKIDNKNKQIVCCIDGYDTYKIEYPQLNHLLPKPETFLTKTIQSNTDYNWWYNKLKDIVPYELFLPYHTKQGIIDTTIYDGIMDITPYEKEYIRINNIDSKNIYIVNNFINEQRIVSQHASSLDYIPLYEGIVEDLHFPYQVYEEPNHTGSVIWNSCNEIIQLPPKGYDFVAYSVCVGNTPYDAQKNLFMISKQFHWRLRSL